MRGKNHRGKPSEFHAPCTTSGCKNFYDTRQKEAEAKCKPCRQREK
jgi:hypothetical protein